MKRPAVIERSTIEASRRFHAQRDKERLRAREALRRERLAAVRAAVGRLAREFPAVQAVHVYGSLLEAGRFTRRSDLDLALDCEDLEEEGRFWRALEEDLGREVDLRPRLGLVAEAIQLRGERIYEREAPAPATEHPERPRAD